MSYLQKKNSINSQHNTFSNIANIASIAKAVSVVGLAYLAYKKRHHINKGFIQLKDNAHKFAQPIADNVSQKAHNISHGIKDKTQKLQDFVEEKAQDTTNKLISFGNDIEEQYGKLEGKAKDDYIMNLKTLREQIDKITN